MVDEAYLKRKNAMTETAIHRESIGRRTPYSKDGALFAHKTILIGSPEPRHMAPNAFLVEQEPNTELPVHFHGYGQFQIFVNGSGKLGQHELRAPMVHYAGQRSAYGPIKAGEAGLSYLTLRAATEGAAFYMPESRHLRDPKIPRFERSAYGEVSITRESCIQSLLSEDTPGLGAWLACITNGQTIVAPELSNGSGRFYVVLEGQWRREQHCLEDLDIVWANPSEAPLELTAGEGGLVVMIVQLPANACEHPHPAPDRPQNTKIGG